MKYRYCGRDFHSDELVLIRRLIDEDPSRTRAELSRLTCQALGWRKADGAYKAMSARVAMLRMHEDGLLELPPPRRKRPDWRVCSSARTDPRAPLHKPAGALRPLRGCLRTNLLIIIYLFPEIVSCPPRSASSYT
jgi:hypothetical protein